jgi:hypothetical protein
MNTPVRVNALVASTESVAPAQPLAATQPIAAAKTETGAITPEIVAAIDAAVTAFAGRKLRIISIKLASNSHNHASTWADQGLNLNHASHNLIQRGH